MLALAVSVLTLSMTGAFADVDETLTPTDDVWAYGIASNHTSDQYLRAWGDGTQGASATWPPEDGLSYSYLKFDLSKLPEGKYDLKDAKIVVVCVPSAARTLETMKEFPLEARPLASNWDEKTWSFDGKNPVPGAKPYGTGTVEGFKAEADYKVVIDLLKEPGAFAADFNKAVQAKGSLAVALTSKMSPGDASGAFYKFYSSSANKDLRPMLILKGSRS